ncbi:lipoprotein, partial [Lutibacter sp.]|uniref:lipoprotein n=1 Tax=Lutibacter sp. TaxID=1925666 RepID=UPI00356845EA
MKKLVLILTITILLTACNKDNDSIAPIDQLPEATQTGENTFGCLLNGEAFLPSGGVNPLDCVYEYYDGSYHFALQGNRRDDLGYL